MKYLLILVTSLAAASPGFSQVWTTQIRQLVGGEQGVEMGPATVDADGKGELKSLPLPAAGATYQLVVLSDNVAKTVVNKSLGAYQVSAKVVLNTRDTTFSKYDNNGSTTLARTRVDWPYTVTYSAAGLLVGAAATVEDAGKKVAAQHSIRTFPGGAFVAPDALAWTTKSTTDLTQNGTYAPLTFDVPNITAPDLLNAAGEERFILNSLAGFQSAPGELANARLQVWPVASATISGVTDGKKYQAIPDVAVQMNNLYPDSRTYVIVYKGSPAQAESVIASGNYTIAPSASVSVNDQSISAVPIRNSQFNIPGSGENGLDNIINQDGQWTLVVVHEIFPRQTPQPAGRPAPIKEISTSVSFTYQTTIHVNGQIFSSE